MQKLECCKNDTLWNFDKIDPLKSLWISVRYYIILKIKEFQGLLSSLIIKSTVFQGFQGLE